MREGQVNLQASVTRLENLVRRADEIAAGATGAVDFTIGTESKPETGRVPVPDTVPDKVIGMRVELAADGIERALNEIEAAVLRLRGSVGIDGPAVRAPSDRPARLTVGVR